MSTNEVVLRILARIIPAINTTDGAGVRRRRSLGRGTDVRPDPFWILDEFSSDNPGYYI